MKRSAGDGLGIVAAALLLTLAYPPFELVWPAFLCLVPAALLILRGGKSRSPLRSRLITGFWYGTITSAVLLYWLASALWSLGRAAVALWAMAAIVFGIVHGIMFAVVGRSVDGSPGRLILAFPAGIVALEWIAAHAGPIALPWYTLALSVTSSPLLVQAADIAGSPGLAFVLACINSLLALAWWQRKRSSTALLRVEIAASLLLVLALYGGYRLNSVAMVETGSASVIQTAIPADEKWLPERQDAVVERAVRLTKTATEAHRPDLIVWPETAIPDALDRHPQWRGRITQVTRATAASLITGSIAETRGVDGTIRGNVALMIDPATANHEPGVEVHRKHKLVPLVERVGLFDLSLDGGDGFTAGTLLTPIDHHVGRVGALVCYEITFADMPRELRRLGATVLVVVSNDAWLGRTNAAAQHFAHGVLRAVENRMTVVRSTNDGISGVIDPLGRIVTRTDAFEEGFATSPVYRSASMPTAALIAGFTGPAALILLLGLVLIPRRLQPDEGSTTAGAHPLGNRISGWT